MGNIIWLASYPKSGNTWLRSFLHNLIENPTQPFDINKMSEHTVSDDDIRVFEKALGKKIIDRQSDEVIAIRAHTNEMLTQLMPTNVMIKTHAFLGQVRGHPQINLNVTAGTIYIVRNPLDVVLSAANHWGLSIDDTIIMMNSKEAATGDEERCITTLINTWSEHVDSWTANPHPTLHVVRYEDMLDHPNRTFGGIVKFLGLNPPKAVFDKALKFSSFKVLQNQERQKGFVERHPKSKSFFRAGSANQWKKVLTPAQRDQIIHDHERIMTKFGYLPL